jgi:23S rRNA (cytosine1962-C5)-methyltransferase
MVSPFTNRLQKNFRHFRKWAQRQRISAFRVYDRDLPEYPFVVEWYEGRVHLVEFPRRRPRGDEQALRDEVLRGVVEVLDVPPTHVFTKTHLPKPWGQAQYGREGESGDFFEVHEHGLKLLVNLCDFLDTGLFLDHRDTRGRVRAEASGSRFLNLFCYTGAFSVHAAAGGARSTTSVDLSNTYLDWARRNLSLNGYGSQAHRLVRADVTTWVREAALGERFDLIVLDPPSFSTSKKMLGSFNVQRDHVKLLSSVLALLAPKGTLYFSTNYRGFQLDQAALGARFDELTPRSLPPDIHQRDIHRCWHVQHR